MITGFGEETGWRGYALARLQRRHGPIRATLTVTAGWAIWHIPLFFVLASYADFGPLMALGWLIGLAAGAFVLTAVFNVTGGSVLAVAVWHATYNAGAGTNAGDGLVAPLDDRVRHLLGGHARAATSQRTSRLRAPSARRRQNHVKHRKSLHDDGLDLHGSARQGARSSHALSGTVLVHWGESSRSAGLGQSEPAQAPERVLGRENSFAQLIDALAPPRQRRSQHQRRRRKPAVA